MSTLPHRIKLARERKGWTPNRLGVEAGLAQGMVYRLESGERAKRGSSGETVAKVARALGVRLEWLMTGEGPIDAGAEDPVPARTAAASIARDGGVHEDAITSIMSEAVSAEDTLKPTLWWIDRMRRRELDLMSAPERPPMRRRMTPAPITVPAKSGKRRKVEEEDSTISSDEAPAVKPSRKG